MKLPLYLLTEDTDTGYNIGVYTTEQARLDRCIELMRQTTLDPAVPTDKAILDHLAAEEWHEAWDLWKEDQADFPDYFACKFIEMSQWFTFDPLPDGLSEFTVKEEFDMTPTAVSN